VLTTSNAAALHQVWLAVGQGVSTGTITSPMGVGAALGAWKPDVQLPIPEKNEQSIYMAPYTIYRPKMQFHRKGEQQQQQPHAMAAHLASAEM
jgi:hypothetical protein